MLLKCLTAYIVTYLNGTAWLSSARVVECPIYLLNERNLQFKCQIFFLLKKHISICLIKFYLVYFL
jgi:hypothetical protein